MYHSSCSGDGSKRQFVILPTMTLNNAGDSFCPSRPNEPARALATSAAAFAIVVGMSPTIFRDGRFRFFFFSREEERLHVQVQSPDGEAKF
jgi:hypothetical protein